MDESFTQQVERIANVDARYKGEAYEFVMEALAVAQKLYRRRRHVTGQELLDAARMLAVKKFGGLALNVFYFWGIRRTDDIGHIVFNMVNHGILCQSEDDSFESFQNVYNLKTAFEETYRQQMAAAVRRLK